MTFEQLPPLLGEALAARGYASPTPVQAAVLEADAEGRDLIVSAQTGSGKTVAFGLAIAPQLLEAGGTLPYALAPVALVIAPTRELALQVSRELAWLYRRAGARIATCVGGMDASRERRSLRDGASRPSAISCSAMARPKATVLPEPVWAETRRSRPLACSSSTAAWTGVGAT